VKKKPFFVLSAALLVAAGAASYAVASQGGGPEAIPNTKVFHATLSGYQETPAISSTGFGEFSAKLDDSASPPTIHFVFSYSSLEGQKVTDGKILFAHVHFGQTGVAGGVSYFLCDNSPVPAVPRTCPDDGSGSGTVAGDITAANVIGPNGQGIEPGSFDEIVRAMQAGKAYANIHTTRWPAGEIRGQINSKTD
jgi:hypothetical protein